MIELNTSGNGKPKDFLVRVIKTYEVHTCDENPKEAINEMFLDGTIDDFKEDKIDLEAIDCGTKL